MEFEQPLPNPILHVIKQASLCYLATCEGAAPHLSLMKFSFEEGVFVLTTRRDTRKFRAMSANSSVAILIHDFDGQAPGTFTVTLYGTAEEVLDPIAAERLRAIHLARNPGYAHFIASPEIAVITLRPARCRLCNLADEVSTWVSS